ncbi:UbiD family decarboxylase [Halogeometricum limi]|uniref:4-hydroxy-3-polyprenylbenzoate decarboxylase n=1 Tax=Halogeometricum limi TaxID=555875 RepID=A0A1I6IAV7_9EURY|nr:UbiD family decarboxylase [Halogeometricum limi]SFR63872.1 4-hydroxy-3-polyprenylbenzoate decarboxylase [Halogeometricum limi]
MSDDGDGIASEPSLRAYLDTLDEAGDLVRVTDEVSWDLEASAIAMRAGERDAQIPLFESVARSGVPGARLVGDPYRGSQRRPWDRIATALGLPADTDGATYYDAMLERLTDPVEPTTVASTPDAAPCKEVVHVGDDVDLLSFPWPYIHSGDGGRYSNLHTLVAPDPDSEWVDWSTHRAMVHDDRQASVLLLAGEQTPNLFYYKYERRDEPMPVAIVVGTEPAVQCTSVMWIPTGSDEARYAGGLRRAPVELVQCETNDLYVPANAELVVEGHLVPDKRLDEGPFGDYFGYMHGPRRSMPALEVDAVTHRESPIIPFCVEGTGVGYTENTTSSMEAGCVGPDATLGLRAAGFDVIRCVPWQFTPRTAYVVATETNDPGALHELANFIFTTWGMLHIDFFIFVDASVDPFDTREVLEAIALHADPDADFHQFGTETMPKVPLNIYQTPDEKGDAQTGTSKAKTAKAYIDATGSAAARPDVVSADSRDRARELLATAGVVAEEGE